MTEFETNITNRIEQLIFEGKIYTSDKPVSFYYHPDVMIEDIGEFVDDFEYFLDNYKLVDIEIKIQ